MPLIEFAHRKPTKVILYGDCSGDRRLKETVMEVLKAFMTDAEMPEWIDRKRTCEIVKARRSKESSRRQVGRFEYSIVTIAYANNRFLTSDNSNVHLDNRHLTSHKFQTSHGPLR